MIQPEQFSESGVFRQLAGSFGPTSGCDKTIQRTMVEIRAETTGGKEHHTVSPLCVLAFVPWRGGMEYPTRRLIALAVFVPLSGMPIQGRDRAQWANIQSLHPDQTVTLTHVSANRRAVGRHRFRSDPPSKYGDRVRRWHGHRRPHRDHFQGSKRLSSCSIALEFHSWGNMRRGHCKKDAT